MRHRLLPSIFLFQFSICVSCVVLLSLSDGKERLEDRFVAADGTFAGRGKSIALGEYKTAGAAFGRGHLQMAASSVDAVTDMLQVTVDLFFRDVCVDGYLPGGKRLVKDEPA